MSFLDCIKSTAALTAPQRQQIEKDYDKHYKTYQQTIGDNEAAHLAATRVVQSTITELNAKNKAAINDILTYRQIKVDHAKLATNQRLKRNEAGKKGKLLFWWSDNEYASHQILENAFNAQMAKEREYTIKVAPLLDKYGSKKLGFTQDVEGFKKVISEHLGKDTGDKVAKEEAKLVKEIFGHTGNDFRAAGGVMGEMPNYFPQRHVAQLVSPPKKDSNASFEEWYNFHMPLLDWSKMIDDSTGMPFFEVAGQTLTPFQLRRLKPLMRDIFNEIESQGLNDILDAIQEQKTNVGKGQELMNKRSASRFFIYKDADSYFKYNNKYGVSDEGLFDTFVSHIESMARDVGLMKVLGAKPLNQYKRLALLASQDNKDARLWVLENMWKNISGSIRRPLNDAGLASTPRGTAYVWRGIANLSRATLLVRAPLSSLSDTVSLNKMARLNGLSQYKIAKNYLKILNPKNPTDRRFARRAVLISQSVSGNSIRQAKYTSSMELRNNNTKAGKFDSAMGAYSATMHRATGMSVMSDAARQASYMTVGGLFDEYKRANIKYKELPELLKNSMDKYGLGENEYDAIMRGNSTQIQDDLGYLFPEGMLAEDKKTAFKYEMWLTELSQLGSNESRLFTQAMINMGNSFGTGERAVLSSVMMFKSFAITQLVNHIAPLMRDIAAAKGMRQQSKALAQAAAYFVPLTILGALGLQLKSIAMGFFFEEMTNEETAGDFWLRATLQGGGLSFLGDFVQNDTTEYGNNIYVSLAGAPVGTAIDMFALGQSAIEATFGDDPKDVKDFRQRLSKAVGKYAAPMNMWYNDLIMNRVIMDSIERAIDPNFDRRMRNLEKRKLEERGAEPWWGAN
jgi:hypothetical protein